MSTKLHAVTALTTVALLAAAGCARQQPSAPQATPAAAQAAATPMVPAPDDVSDARVETAVRLALLQKLGVQSLGIDIDVTGGAVTLSGDVADPTDKQVALETTRGVDGVASVTDQLGVTAVSGEAEGPVQQVSQEVQDEILAAQVKLALFSDMDAAAFDVDVDASKGVVTLHGTVPDENSHKLAVATARSTDGVTSVTDDLTVQPAPVPGPYVKDEEPQ